MTTAQMNREKQAAENEDAVARQAAELQQAMAKHAAKLQVELALRQMLDYFHTLDYADYLKRGGKNGIHHIRRETCMNYGARSAYMPGWGQRWHIRPSIAFLSAIGFAVAETMVAVDEAAQAGAAQDEKNETQPTEH